MVNEDVKTKMRGKLSEVNSELADDISKSKIEKECEGIKVTDGKVVARFAIEGDLMKESKSKKEPASWDDNHVRWTKIFDNWKELSTYAENFFNSTNDELKEIIKNKDK